MNKEAKLKLGVEIISAMKASAYGVTLEQGRIMALEYTEAELMPDIEFNSASEENKDMYKLMASREKELLHQQAFFVADVAINWLYNYDMNNEV